MANVPFSGISSPFGRRDRSEIDPNNPLFKIGQGIRNFFENPLDVSTTLTGGPLPEDSREGRFGEVRDIFGLVKELNAPALEEALAAIEGGQTRIDELLGGRVKSIEEDFPVTPFGEKRFEAQKNVIFDAINREIESQSQQAAINLNARGALRGSQATQRFGELQAGGVRARASTLSALFRQQAEENQQAARFRETLISGIEETQAGLQTRLDAISAALESGERVAPSLIIELLGDIEAIDRSEQREQEFFDFINETREGQESGFARFVAAFPDIFELIFPSAGQGRVGADILSSFGAPTTPRLGD